VRNDEPFNHLKNEKLLVLLKSLEIKRVELIGYLYGKKLLSAINRVPLEYENVIIKLKDKYALVTLKNLYEIGEN
jgi:hypothetical protein